MKFDIRHLVMGLLLVFLASGVAVAADEDMAQQVSAACEKMAEGKDDPAAYMELCIQMNTVAVNMADDEVPASNEENQ